VPKRTAYKIILITAVLVVSMLTFSVKNVGADGIVGDMNGDDVVDARDIEIASNAVNSWPGHPRWNPLADLDGDGKISAMDICIIAHHIGKKITMITVSLKINPCVLNLRSKGRWITALIEFPEGYSAKAVNISSILLNGTIRAESRPHAMGDFDCDGKEELMLKFNRRALANFILENYHCRTRIGRITLTITGNFADGTRFKGSTTQKVLFTSHRCK